MQNEGVPVMAEGGDCTVNLTIVLHPVAVTVYATVSIPTDDPVIAPVPAPIGLILVLLALHVPPPVASDNVVVEPRQIVVYPAMAVGNGFTVTMAVREHPVVESV